MYPPSFASFFLATIYTGCLYRPSFRPDVNTRQAALMEITVRPAGKPTGTGRIRSDDMPPGAASSVPTTVVQRKETTYRDRLLGIDPASEQPSKSVQVVVYETASSGVPLTEFNVEVDPTTGDLSSSGGAAVAKENGYRVKQAVRGEPVTPARFFGGASSSRSDSNSRSGSRIRAQQQQVQQTEEDEESPPEATPVAREQPRRRPSPGEPYRTPENKTVKVGFELPGGFYFEAPYHDVVPSEDGLTLALYYDHSRAENLTYARPPLSGFSMQQPAGKSRKAKRRDQESAEDPRLSYYVDADDPEQGGNQSYREYRGGHGPLDEQEDYYEEAEENEEELGPLLAVVYPWGTSTGGKRVSRCLSEGLILRHGPHEYQVLYVVDSVDVASPQQQTEQGNKP